MLGCATFYLPLLAFSYRPTRGRGEMDRTFDHRNEEWAVVFGSLAGRATSAAGAFPLPTHRRVWFVRASDGREIYGRVQPILDPTDDHLREALERALTRPTHQES